DNTQMKSWVIGSVSTQRRSSSSTRTASSSACSGTVGTGFPNRTCAKSKGGGCHGGPHRLGDPGKIVEERRHRHCVLPHGRADAARRILLHQGRNPSARRAPRAIRRVHGTGL